MEKGLEVFEGVGLGGVFGEVGVLVGVGLEVVEFGALGAAAPFCIPIRRRSGRHEW